MRDRAGKSASLMAEKFAFQQIEWNSSAIQFYEWASAALAQIVNRPRDQFFSCASFSLDKNSGVRRRDLLDLLKH